MKQIYFLCLLVLIAPFTVMGFSQGVVAVPQPTETWVRVDKACPDPRIEKTTCTAGGGELCTPQYCNKIIVVEPTPL